MAKTQKMSEGCAYGEVTRQIVMDIRKDIQVMREEIRSVANHYHNRLPTWASVLITLMGIIIGALLRAAVN